MRLNLTPDEKNAVALLIARDLEASGETPRHVRLLDVEKHSDGLYAIAVANGRSYQKKLQLGAAPMVPAPGTTVRYAPIQIIQQRSGGESSLVITGIASTDRPTLVRTGREILDHRPECIDLKRARRGLPICVGHNHEDIVGVTDEIRNTGSSLVIRARIGRSERAKEIAQDIRDGVRKYLSIGYFVHKYVRESDAEGELIRAVRWEPFEISVVSVPADYLAVISV